MKKLVFGLGLAMITMGFYACTVAYSTSGADIPASATTFSVRTFQIATPMASPLYGQLLTEGLKDLMLTQTRLDLVDRKGDLQYEGVVTGYLTGNAAVSGNEQTTINRLTVTVNVTYVNTIEREKNFEKAFTRWADFPSNTDFNDVEQALITEINDQLTQDIFDASLGAW
jgi:hypothetical protein